MREFEICLPIFRSIQFNVMLRDSALVFVLCFTFYLNSQAQVEDTIKLAYRQGRGMIGLAGSISSSKVDQNSSIGNPEDFINNYTFDVSIGKFIFDRHFIGTFISTNRRNSFDILDTEREILLIGGEYRYYLGKAPNMGLFLQGGGFWASYYESTQSDQTVVPINEEIDGRGIGAVLGLGYSYALADLVVFEVGFNSFLSHFEGDTRDIVARQTNDASFNRFDYRFYFGLNLLFGKPKDEK